MHQKVKLMVQLRVVVFLLLSSSMLVVTVSPTYWIRNTTEKYEESFF